MLKELKHCLICSHNEMKPFANLGEQPLANAYHATSWDTYPLELRYCAKCDHVQLGHSVSPEELFCQYDYLSGTSGTLLKYFESFVDRVEAQYPNRKLFVLDIGCNDGSLLQCFKNRGHKVLGVDPSDAPVNIAKDNGIDVFNCFWDESVAGKVISVYGHADVVVAMNVVAHTPNPVEFVKACNKVVNPNGVVYLQTSQAEMLKKGEFDTVYHEHVSYYSIRSMNYLADICGFRQVKASIVPIHGGSYLFELYTGSGPRGRYGFRYPARYDTGMYKAFNAQMTYTVLRFAELCAEYEDYTPIAYGAAAKGTVFFNVLKRCPEIVIDDNTLKQGGHVPGFATSNIVPSSFLLDIFEREKLLFVVPAWNCKDEIAANIRKLRPNSHDKLIVWHPTPEVIDVQ